MKTFKGVKAFIEENSIARVRVKEDRLKLKFKYLEDINIAQEEDNVILGNKIVFEILGQVFSETYSISIMYKQSENIVEKSRGEAWMFGEMLMKLGYAISAQAKYGISGKTKAQGGRIIKRF